MSKSRPPSPAKRSFSRRFHIAMTETRIMDAMAKADGWDLARLAEAPVWLRQLYSRHAEAARREMQKAAKTDH